MQKVTANIINCRRYLSPISICILLWQDLHRLIRLLSSCVPPFAIGKIWCTSSTGVYRPSFRHNSQSGCEATYLLRIFWLRKPYVLWTFASRSYLSYCLRATFLCFSQYCSSVKFGQLGKRHGFFGAFGIRSLPFVPKKSPQGHFHEGACSIIFFYSQINESSISSILPGFILPVSANPFLR